MKILAIFVYAASVLVLHREVRAARYGSSSANPAPVELEMESLRSAKSETEPPARSANLVSSYRTALSLKSTQCPNCFVIFLGILTISILYTGLTYTLYIKPIRNEKNKLYTQILDALTDSLLDVPSNTSSSNPDLRAAIDKIVAKTTEYLKTVNAEIADLTYKTDTLHEMPGNSTAAP